MERLTPSNYSSLVEAYSAVYSEDLRSKLNEEEQIQEFLQVIDSLLEEGYDLSEYTYDELYEGWKSDAARKVGSWLLKKGVSAAKTAWHGTTKQTEKGIKNIPGAGQTTKELLARGASLLPYAGIAAGANALFGGQLGRIAGDWGKEGIKQTTGALRQVPSPGQPATARPQPEDKKKKDPFSTAPDALLKQDVDLFDLIKGHLLDEGYAETEEAALRIMSNMSEGWKESIIETFFDTNE